VAERWHDGGGRRRWLKLGVRAEESTRELGIERSVGTHKMPISRANISSKCMK
jgi:hypothetical protein